MVVGLLVVHKLLLIHGGAVGGARGNAASDGLALLGLIEVSVGPAEQGEGGVANGGAGGGVARGAGHRHLLLVDPGDQRRKPVLHLRRQAAGHRVTRGESRRLDALPRAPLPGPVGLALLALREAPRRHLRALGPEGPLLDGHEVHLLLLVPSTASAHHCGVAFVDLHGHRGPAEVLGAQVGGVPAGVLQGGENCRGGQLAQVDALLLVVHSIDDLGDVPCAPDSSRPRGDSHPRHSVRHVSQGVLLALHVVLAGISPHREAPRRHLIHRDGVVLLHIVHSSGEHHHVPGELLGEVHRRRGRAQVGLADLEDHPVVGLVGPGGEGHPAHHLCGVLAVVAALGGLAPLEHHALVEDPRDGGDNGVSAAEAGDAGEDDGGGLEPLHELSYPGLAVCATVESHGPHLHVLDLVPLGGLRGPRLNGTRCRAAGISLTLVLERELALHLLDLALVDGMLLDLLCLLVVGRQRVLLRGLLGRVGKPSAPGPELHQRRLSTLVVMVARRRLPAPRPRPGTGRIDGAHGQAQAGLDGAQGQALRPGRGAVVGHHGPLDAHDLLVGDHLLGRAIPSELQAVRGHGTDVKVALVLLQSRPLTSRVPPASPDTVPLLDPLNTRRENLPDRPPGRESEPNALHHHRLRGRPDVLLAHHSQGSVLVALDLELLLPVRLAGHGVPGGALVLNFFGEAQGLLVEGGEGHRGDHAAGQGLAPARLALGAVGLALGDEVGLPVGRAVHAVARLASVHRSVPHKHVHRRSLRVLHLNRLSAGHPLALEQLAKLPTLQALHLEAHVPRRRLVQGKPRLARVRRHRRVERLGPRGGDRRGVGDLGHVAAEFAGADRQLALCGGLDLEPGVALALVGVDLVNALAHALGHPALVVALPGDALVDLHAGVKSVRRLGATVPLMAIALVALEQVDARPVFGAVVVLGAEVNLFAPLMLRVGPSFLAGPDELSPTSLGAIQGMAQVALVLGLLAKTASLVGLRCCVPGTHVRWGSAGHRAAPDHLDEGPGRRTRRGKLSSRRDRPSNVTSLPGKLGIHGVAPRGILLVRRRVAAEIVVAEPVRALLPLLHARRQGQLGDVGVVARGKAGPTLHTHDQALASLHHALELAIL
mmetsp:Transcript_21822/g.49722  ORF Transcript_21822/g.49722 Transcript_21822/m.49722 type:complete len:1107 (-) Transcript_21822:1020-4340(-)